MNLINFSIILFTIIGIIFYNSTYIQNQKEISLVTEFGKVVWHQSGGSADDF